MAVKSQQTVAALADLAGAAPEGTPIVCLQNGIANEPAALRYFPHVHAVCVMCPAGHLEPGIVQAWSAPDHRACWTSAGSPEEPMTGVASVSADSWPGHLPFVRRPPTSRRWKNRKLLLNLGQRGRRPSADPVTEAAALMGVLIAEGEAALAPPDWTWPPGRRPEPAGGPPPARPDRRPDPAGRILVAERAAGYRGHRTDYLNGEIVRLGRLHDVPTPANQLIQTLARKVASSGRPGTMSAASILDQLEV